MSNNNTLAVKPIIQYPHTAQVGQTYLMTIDLLLEANFEWPLDREEYPIYCAVASEAFASNCIGEPVIVLHKFGGSYGEAKFLIETISTEKQGSIEISLINTWGVLVQTFQVEGILITSVNTNQSEKTSIALRLEQNKKTEKEFGNPITKRLGAFSQFLDERLNSNQSEKTSIALRLEQNKKTEEEFGNPITKRLGAFSQFLGERLNSNLDTLITFVDGFTDRLAIDRFNQSIDKKLDQITVQAIKAATRFEGKYMLCQAAECQAFRSEGVSPRDGIWIPLLKEVFVPLQLDHNATQPGFRTIKQRRYLHENRKSRELSIWNFLAKSADEPTFRQLAVLGWGGYGKTTLLKHVAFLYGKGATPADAPKLVPILIVLRQYRELLSRDTPPDISEIITKYHIPNLPGAEHLKVPERWAINLLKQGRALVMFDGFNEVNERQRPALSKWLMSQMQRYSKSTFILTSRPKAYREQDCPVPLALTTSLWVKDFEVKKRRQFVTRWYECQERYANAGRDTPDVKKVAKRSAEDLLEQIESQQTLKDLAKNPLLLNMIVTFHRRFPGAELPKRRVKLYREICSLQLSERPKARRLDTLLTNCDAQEILQQVAYTMMKNNLERISRPALLKWLNQILQEREEVFTAHDFLEQIVKVSELMIKQEDEYEFAHSSFQEYLAATHIAQNKIEHELHDHFQEDWWKPTILLYAGQTNPTRIIREAMNRGEVDLAYSCLRETTKRIDAQLAKELEGFTETVVAARYQPLENYLTTGQWREADQETARLMATGVGKEIGQLLSKDDLLNFPCEDLYCIDELWTRYSHGQYGFSVQSRIYTECGGSINGKHYRQAFEAFGKKVGWRQSQEWQFEMKWQDFGPKGHLPMSALMEPIHSKVKSRRRSKGLPPFQISEIPDEGELFSTLMFRVLECQYYGS